jgi:hypothetical protein
MRIASLLAAAVLTVASFAAQAQTPPNVPAALNISWTLPTETACVVTPTNSCVRFPLTGAYALTGIQLYVSSQPIPDTFTGAVSATLGAGVTTTSYNTVAPNGSTLYIRARAVNADGASVMSDEVAKVVQVPAKPGAPTNVTVTLTISL